jgi:hypothetical protein
MKTKLFLALSLTLATSFAFAQSLMRDGAGKQILSTGAAKESLGSPYLNKSFVKSQVVTVSDKKMDVEALRYNVLTQDVEYQDRVATYAVQDSLKSFTLPDSSGKVLTFVRKKVNSEDGFYEVVVPGKIELLKRYTAKPETSTDWYTKKEVKAIKQQATYYASKDGKIEKVGTSAKSLLTLFADKKGAVATYIKEQSPDLKTETGLADVFKIYNAAN